MILAQSKIAVGPPCQAKRTHLTIRRNAEIAKCRATSLNEGIAQFYDASTGLWEDMWGDHLHHGYYPAGGARKSNREAQEDMIEEVLKWAGVTQVNKMVDVGCGLGGSSRHLSRKYGCSAEGITLSPFQAKRGNEISQQQGLGDRVHLQVCDALNQPSGWSNTYDLVWSLESGEHMPDKQRFVGELVRICAPGGRVIVVTWCHRELKAGETSLRPEEEELLRKICDAYYLPAWCSAGDYKKLFEAQGMAEVRTADWSNEVAPFWGEVIKSALSVRGVMGLLGAGWTTIKGALVMPLMAQGLKMGLIKFALITGVKK
jgi:tocopherol O-methyltransferase